MSKNESNGGVSLFGVVQIVFIILKLVGVITWSWWLVLIPLWVSIALILISLLFIRSFM